MKIQALIIFLFLFSFSLSYARGPAVEDFVGVEMEGPDSPPQGTEGLINFEKEINDFSSNKKKTINQTMFSAQNTTNNSVSAYFGYAVILLLPLISWMMMLNHLKSQAREKNAANLQVLENYRREKEKKQEEIKKAS
jgi:hypothetical protein